VPWKVYPIQVNRLGKLLSYTLAFVLCYSQLVASAHFVEHLPHQSQGNEGLASHSALHAVDQKELYSAHKKASLLASHASFHANHPDLAPHPLESHQKVSHTFSSPEHNERSIADCSIYHFYSALNGLVQARTDIPCSSFDHVITVATRATPHQQSFANHQPIRAPPSFS